MEAHIQLQHQMQKLHMLQQQQQILYMQEE